MRKHSLIPGLIILITGCFIFQSAASQALSNEEIKKIMADDWVRAKAYTQEYLNTMPGDKYSYKAMDSLRSFAQQMLHLASANVFLMSAATDQPPASWASFSLEGRTSAQSSDSVNYFVGASYDYCINAVKNCDPGKWKEKKTMFGFETTKFALLLKAFEHQTHHRGQTTIYIRLNDIRPPQEKLF
ncbi:MAG: DinB family protein [Chitinophagaceae bacterium]